MAQTFVFDGYLSDQTAFVLFAFDGYLFDTGAEPPVVVATRRDIVPGTIADPVFGGGAVTNDIDEEEEILVIINAVLRCL